MNDFSNIKVGDKVALLYDNYGNPYVEIKKVEHVTPQYFFLEQKRKINRKTGKEAHHNLYNMYDIEFPISELTCKKLIMEKYKYAIRQKMQNISKVLDNKIDYTPELFSAIEQLLAALTFFQETVKIENKGDIK